MLTIPKEGIEKIIFLDRVDAPEHYPVDELDDLGKRYVFDIFLVPRLRQCYTSTKFRTPEGVRTNIKRKKKNSLPDLQRFLGESYRELDQDAKDYWQACTLPMAAVVHDGMTPPYLRSEMPTPEKSFLAERIVRNKSSDSLILVSADFVYPLSHYFTLIHVVESELDQFHGAMVECTRIHGYNHYAVRTYNTSGPLLNAAFVGHRADWTPARGVPPFRVQEGSDIVYYEDAKLKMMVASGEIIDLTTPQ